MIVDFHTHVYPADRAGFWKAPSSVADLIRAMDAASVQRAAVIAIAPHIPNDVVAAAAAAHSGRLVAIGSVDPLADPDPLQAVDHAVQHYGARAIKIHPRLQHFGVDDAKRIIAVADRCAVARVPLVICSFQGGPYRFKSRILELCALVAAAVPKATLVLAHAGGHQPIEAMLLQKAHGNVVLDLSFSPLYYRGSSVEQDFGYMVARVDKKKLLFGSDFPEISVAESVSYFRELLDRSRLSSLEVDAVMGGNACRLLGIS